MSNVFSQLFSNDKQSVFFNSFGEEELDYSHGVFNNGLFEKESIKKIGTFITLKSKFEVASPNSCLESFSFSNDFCKIPIGLLFATIDFYRLVMKKFSNSEVMTMVVYDSNLNDYKIVVPTQTVSGATVSYDHIEFSENEHYICSMHSHNTMDAFFSVPDDNDEKKPMLYGVIGKLSELEDETPRFKFRAKKGTFQKELSVKDIFDDNLKSKDKYIVDDENLLKIKTLNEAYGKGFPFKNNRYYTENYGNFLTDQNSYDYYDQENHTYFKKNKPYFSSKNETLELISQLDTVFYFKLMIFLKLYQVNLFHYLSFGEFDTEKTEELAEAFYNVFTSIDADNNFDNIFFEKCSFFEDFDVES